MSVVKENIVTALAQVGVGVVFCVGKIGLKIPFTRKKIYKVMLQLSKANEVEDFKDTMFKKEMYKNVVRQMVIDMTKTVKLNKRIPNFSLIKMTNEKTNKENDIVTMFNMQRKGVPLVLNFGSCS